MRTGNINERNDNLEMYGLGHSPHLLASRGTAQTLDQDFCWDGTSSIGNGVSSNRQIEQDQFS